MINLLVDEAYALDYLAILYVKQQKSPSVDKIETYTTCYRLLSQQLCNFSEIINSVEYKNLVNSNKYTFELIDKLRKNQTVSAKEIDDANIDRYTQKVNLQKEFFPNSPIKETKIF